MRGTPRRALASACLAHALHDGLTSAVLVLLPVFQTQYALSFAAVGLLRATTNGTMAAAQIPAGRLAERFGARTIIVAGTVTAGLGYLAAGLSGGLWSVFWALALIGLGTSVQHPIASELIAASYEKAQRRMALGVYNFTGDVGKAILPPLAALLLTLLDWRIVCAAICAITLGVALVLVFGTPSAPSRDETREVATPAGTPKISMTPFKLLTAIGMLDSATRTVFLTFLPFLLAGKGGTLETTGLALSLVFVGGACGKLVCAWLSVRLGPIATVILSEVMTAVAIVAVMLLPLQGALACLPLLGIALNGTSSVLYGSVGELTPDAYRQRAFAIFYTATSGSDAVAPVIGGLFIDRAGLPAMLICAAALALAVVPLALILRPALQAPWSGASTSPSR